MKRTKQFILTGHMVRDICAKSSRERFLHRLHCVALVCYGLSSSEVARIFDDSPRAVAYWVKRFKLNGLDGLKEESRPGRPSGLDPAQLKKLQTFLKREDSNSRPLKAETVSEFIVKEFGVVLSTTQCWRILKRLTT